MQKVSKGNVIVQLCKAVAEYSFLIAAAHTIIYFQLLKELAEIEVC